MTSDVIAICGKYRYRFATGGKLILFKHVLLSSILVNNRVIVIENGKTIFQLQLQYYRLLKIFNYNYSKIVSLIAILSITIIIFPSLSAPELYRFTV